MILATRRGDIEMRSQSLGELIEARNPRTAGVVVNDRTVAGLPAATRAIAIAAQAVASRKLRVWLGEGVERAPVLTTWQARLFAGVPNERESWFDILEQTERSLTGRNNAYWHKLPDGRGRVAAVYVLSADDLEVKWDSASRRKLFRFRLDLWSSQFSDWVDSSRILHFRGLNEPGYLIDPSPIALHRDALGAAIAKTKYESGFYDHGVQQSIAISFPASVTPEQAKAWQEVYQADHGGIEKAHGVSVFGGGVDVSKVGLTLQDAQYIESMQFSVEELARIFGVHASLLQGGTTSGAQGARPLSPEHEEDRWLRYGLGPRFERIENTLRADPSFFGASSRAYPEFALAGTVRGDLATEAEISLKKVQSGQWLVDEARARDGLPPLPGGVGSIPQIVPVGGAPNPVPVLPPA